ncbi:hypothetical protein, partial [Thermovenabulum sp.]
FIARRIALNNLKEWLKQQFDRQCGRVRYDIAQRMEKTFKEYYNYLEEKITETAEGIMDSVEKALELKKSGEQNVKSLVEELEKVLKRVSEIENGIRKIKKQIEGAV